MTDADDQSWDEDESVLTFLDCPESPEADVDVAILSLPYELTTSYGQGTADGPAACIQASSQVELYDSDLGEDLPAGLSFHTAPAWSPEKGSLMGQLDEMVEYLLPWFEGDCFPLVLGGEHGILPPIVKALASHQLVQGDLSKVTIVHIDAHADLRSELGGEKWSHACAASRALDLGIGRLMQVGIRAYSKEEAELIGNDERISTWFARDVMSPSNGSEAWRNWLEALRNLEGPVHLTFDIDGLDGSLVPATGTPVPGGLSFHHAVETIQAVFSAENACVISADVNEISEQKDSPLTQFTSAMIATKILASHVLARKNGQWRRSGSAKSAQRDTGKCYFFQEM